jgi:TRAP-type C4-dicarboxylate transport system substrate-binding protein
MKKGLLGLLAVMVFAIGILSTVRAAEPIKLKSANYLPTTHPMSALGAWFCDEIKKRTNGRVEITYYPGGTLLSPVKMYDGVVTGIADMGLSHISYTRGRFPIMEVFENPLGFPNGWVATQVTTDFYEKFKPKDWNEVHPLYINTSGPLLILTVSKAIKTLDDMKGVKIRATGQMSEVIKALGGVPMPLEMPDVYDSMRRNVIEGTTNDLSTLKYWKFSEVNKYVTADWQLGTGYTFYFVMNKDKWAALPADIQKIFTEVALETKEKQALLWNTMDIEGADVFKAAGGQTFFLTDAEAARWVKAVEPVLNGYKKSMTGKGFKEADVDGWVKFIKERTEYWKEEAKKKKVPSPF